MTRLPSVTVGDLRRIPPWRALAAAGGLALAVLAFSPSRPEGAHPEPPRALSRTLAPAAGAVRLPHAWLAAPPARLAPGERIDLIGARGGERGGVVSVAVDARVLELEADALVLELAGDEPAAVASARANGYALLVVLRSSR